MREKSGGILDSPEKSVQNTPGNSTPALQAIHTEADDRC